MVGKLKASQDAGTKKRIIREDKEKQDVFYNQAMEYARKTVAFEKKKFEEKLREIKGEVSYSSSRT